MANSNNFTKQNILDAVEYMGFRETTPIQEKAIPVILKGDDLIGCAQTGTGKTAAYLLPIMNEIIYKRPPHTHTLILVPTRELALQIDQQIQGLAYTLNITSLAVYGGGEGSAWDQEREALSHHPSSRLAKNHLPIMSGKHNPTMTGKLRPAIDTSSRLAKNHLLIYPDLRFIVLQKRKLRGKPSQTILLPGLPKITSLSILISRLWVCKKKEVEREALSNHSSSRLAKNNLPIYPDLTFIVL